ncbi:MAG: STAS domain-containing protein [Mycobacteriales bacterium]
MDTPLTLDLSGDCAVVTCTGDLDLHLAGDLRRIIGTACRSGAKRVVIDVSRTDVVDSTALGVLLHANNACRETGTTMVVAGAPRLVARSISLTGLDRVFNMAPDVEAGAVADFSRA